jgi:flagellar basal body P-ring formation protein FlgA
MLRPLSTALMLLLALALPLAAPAEEAPAPAAAPVTAITVRVLPRAEVPGAEFTLGEVAELDGADLDAVRHLAAVSLGRSPLPGHSLRLNEAYVRARLTQVMDTATVQISVPPVAEVLRAAQVIPGADVAAKVLAYAADSAALGAGELEQELAQPVPDVTLPSGEVEWGIEQMGQFAAAGGARTFRVVARMNGEEVWRTLVRINQQVFRRVVVAAHAVRRNAMIRSGDVTVERKPVNGLKEEAYLTRAEEVLGAKAKRPIGPGEWITRTMLTAVADVAEGGPVLLVYQTEAVRFTSPGVALVPAKVGEFIPVRNLESGKIVYGIVQKDESVKVN